MLKYKIVKYPSYNDYPGQGSDQTHQHDAQLPYTMADITEIGNGSEHDPFLPCIFEGMLRTLAFWYSPQRSVLYWANNTVFKPEVTVGISCQQILYPVDGRAGFSAFICSYTAVDLVVRVWWCTVCVLFPQRHEKCSRLGHKHFPSVSFARQVAQV